ncbi:hypothetical protein EB118_11180 [bacterium]|nr:hypothetical protein [bacterium]
MRRTTKLRGKYIEDFTLDDIEKLSRTELSVFYILLQLLLLDEIDKLVSEDKELKQAKDLLFKFIR